MSGYATGKPPPMSMISTATSAVADHLGHQCERGTPCQRIEALRADMEAQPKPRGVRTRGTQQRGGFGWCGTELAGQVQHRRTLRQCEAHDQTEFACHAGRRGLLQDLRQLFSAVEHEVAHAVPRPRLADRTARLDRMHEVDDGVGKHLPHQRNLGDRRAIVMRHAAGMYGTQHAGLRVALHRVQHMAGKRLDECARVRLDRRGTQAVHWNVRPLGGDQFVHRWQRCGRGKTTAQGRNSGAKAQRVHGRNPRRHLARDVARPAAETGGRAIAARITLRRHTQPMLRVLRIAANRSANIGGSLTTPAPRLDRTDRKGRVTSLLCPKGFQRGARGTCDASSNRLTQGVKRERGYRDYGGRADMRTSMVSQAPTA